VTNVVEMFDFFKISFLIQITIDYCWKITFCTSQGTSALFFWARWAHLHFTVLQFLQDVIYQKVLKLVDFFMELLKRNKGLRHIVDSAQISSNCHAKLYTRFSQKLDINDIFVSHNWTHFLFRKMFSRAAQCTQNSTIKYSLSCRRLFYHRTYPTMWPGYTVL